MPEFLRGQARSHIENKELEEGRDLTYDEINDLLKQLFRDYDLAENASQRLHKRKQLYDEGISTFISALQKLGRKAYPDAPEIARKAILGRLGKGLKMEWLRNFVKTTLATNTGMKVNDLEKLLTKLEDQKD